MSTAQEIDGKSVRYFDVIVAAITLAVITVCLRGLVVNRQWDRQDTYALVLYLLAGLLFARLTTASLCAK